MRKVAVVVAVCMIAALLFVGIVQAAPDIVDPPTPSGMVNVFAGIPANTPIRAGLDLGNGCSVASVDLPSGYLNRGDSGAYAIGKGWKQVVIKCEPEVEGIFAYGDNDHYPLSTVCFDDVCWTPPFGADAWHTEAFQGVRYFTITSYGDSGFFTVFVRAPGGDTDTGTPTPAETPTPGGTPTGTPTGSTTGTPVASITPTPDLTTTPTPVAWDQSSIEVEGSCDAGVPTFAITNQGNAMQGASRYWFVNGPASAATCGAIAVDPLFGETLFQLGSGETIDVVFPKGDLVAPYSICVAQRDGYPGGGFAAATVGQDETCVTSELIGAEPVAGEWRSYLPQIGTGK